MEIIANRPKKKLMKLEDMSREEIRQAILKKRECNAKAQKIVESLLDEGVTDAYLLQCLPDINQSHFDDIVEERAILNLCGYPICQHAISSKDVPKQKYRISLKTNKVYDITARKSFCSNSCYKSAMYAKQQMLTSPLWFREHEVVPQFHLLPLNSVGTMGLEVDLGAIERVRIKPDDKPVFTSINDFASATFTEMTNKEKLDCSSENEIINPQSENVDNLEEEKIIKTLQKMQLEADTNANLQNKLTEKKQKPAQNTSNIVGEIIEKKQKPAQNTSNIVGEIIEKAERKIDPILTQKLQTPTAVKATPTKPKKIQEKKQPSVTALAIEVEKCLAQWFTLDTTLLLYGEDKVREMVSNKGQHIKEYLNNYSQGIFYNSNAYDQYQQLCKKLNMLELEDKRADAKTLQKQMQPLPDYSILQEESKRMELKVKAFMAGETEILEPEQKQDPNKNIEDGNVTQLPLVDKNAQNALRRRIVFQHLHKVLPDLLRSLGLLSLTVSSDVRLLVNTFKLKADNIMFKPIQWNLIALIFIKLLSIRDKRLEYLLEQSMAYQHMQLLLLSYKLDGGYLDRLISWLTDIDRLIDKNDMQLTLD